MTTPFGSHPSEASPPDVTQLLRNWSHGDRSAGEGLMAAVYAELHQQAARAMGRETPEHTLQATALVNEAYLRLIDQSRVNLRNPAHFFGVAFAVPLGVAVAGGASHTPEGIVVLAPTAALERLAALDPGQARIVELRYFGGMTIEDTAEAVGLSPATIKREWAVARAWLRRELGTS